MMILKKNDDEHIMSAEDEWAEESLSSFISSLISSEKHIMNVLYMIETIYI